MNKRFIVLVVLLATIVLSGCGGDYNGPKLGGSTAVVDTTPPAVSSTNPTNGATNVSATVNISATFSEAINPLSINIGTFFVTDGVTAVSGTTAVVGTTATFNPSASLALGTTYTATITTGVVDIAGNALAASYTWSFTTSAAPDTTPPTVTAVVPTNGATNVSINTAAVQAVFSESLLGSSVTSTTFLISRGGTPVAGTVSLAGGTATFAPASALSSGTTYSATLTTGVRDLAGNALATAYNWTFTTAPAPTITDTSLPIGTQTGSYTYQLQASGGYGTMTWSATGVPSGLSLSAAGVLSSSNITATPGSYPINFTVTDADGVIATKSLSLTIITGPVITTTTLPDATATGPYSAPTLSATGGTPPYSWSATSLPAGLSLTSGGVLSSPTITAAPGSVSVTVTVTDAGSGSNTTSLTLTVNDVPTITTASLPTAQVGILYSSVTLSAINGTTPYASWNAIGLPAGLTFDTLTSAISGTPTGPAGTSNVDFAVTDTNSVVSATTTLPLNVTAAPLISTTTLPDVTTTAVYTAPTLTATGGTLPYSWSATGLPNNLALSLGGDITGTITDPAGSYSVNVTLTDNVGGTDTKTLTLIVNDVPTITTVQADLDATPATNGTPYFFAMSSIGGTAPLSWAWSSAGGLPPGLSIDPVFGEITGTPTAAGTYNIDFTVTDIYSVSSSTVNLSITVN